MYQKPKPISDMPTVLMETICVIDGNYRNIFYHTSRFQEARRIWFADSNPIHLPKILPEVPQRGKYKVRILYATEVLSIAILPYLPQNIKTLKIVEANALSYDFKWANREAINALKAEANCEQNTDILIVKNNLLTDTSYTNIALLIDGQWLTPQTPLLAGTERANLLKKGIIKQAFLKPNHLKIASKVRLFNAMRPFEEAWEVDNFIF